MPNASTLSSAVETATKCFATRAVGVLDRAGLRQAVPQPLAGEAGVRQRLEGAEGLRRDDEQRRLRVEVRGLLEEVARVDVRDETGRETGLHVRLERLVDHDRAEVRAADADVHDRFDALAGHARPGAVAHRVRERRDLREHLLHVVVDVLPVDGERGGRDELAGGGAAQRRVQHSAVLRDVDVLAGEHRGVAAGHVDGPRDLEEVAQHLLRHQVLRQVDREVGGLERVAARAALVLGEPRAQVRREVVGELGERLPGARGRGIDGRGGHGGTYLSIGQSAARHRAGPGEPRR